MHMQYAHALVAVQLEGMCDAPAEMHSSAVKFNRRAYMWV